MTAPNVMAVMSTHNSPLRRKMLESLNCNGVMAVTAGLENRVFTLQRSDIDSSRRKNRNAAITHYSHYAITPGNASESIAVSASAPVENVPSGRARAGSNTCSQPIRLIARYFRNNINILQTVRHPRAVAGTVAKEWQ